MPRPTLILLLGWASAVLAVGAISSEAAAAEDPHLDPSLVPVGCPACHQGHGTSGSPMLPGPQVPLCLSCHGSRADLDAQVRRGVVAAGARPALLATVLAQPFVHPVSRESFSRHAPGAVTCTSCHSAHRGLPPDRVGPQPAGRPYLSPGNPNRLEHETCELCHGGGAAAVATASDVGRFLDPINRSYHPVEAPSVERSPSVIRELAGRQINCTDCHGNSDPAGPRGPHGSAVPFLLRADYVRVDGGSESAAAYAHCYACHQREVVLSGSSFPLHAEHVVGERTSCATCHDPHGSLTNRALIRFGDETSFGAVAPSVTTGRLEFLSAGPGSGSCYLTCHGYDHAPETYGELAIPVPGRRRD